MRVFVRLGGSVADALGFREKTVEVPEGSTVKQVAEVIGIPISFWDDGWHENSPCVINGKKGDAADILHNDDVLSIYFSNAITGG